jgi:hypothetical protein
MSLGRRSLWHGPVGEKFLASSCRRRVESPCAGSSPPTSPPTKEAERKGARSRHGPRPARAPGPPHPPLLLRPRNPLRAAAAVGSKPQPPPRRCAARRPLGRRRLCTGSCCAFSSSSAELMPDLCNSIKMMCFVPVSSTI